MPNEYYLIYVQFQPENRIQGLPKTTSLIKKLLSTDTLKTVVVDNASKLENVEIGLDRDTDLISGDNSCRDLSGYDKGLRWLLRSYKPGRNSVFFFANDMFHNSTSFNSIERFSPDSVKIGLEKQAVLGFVDAYPKTIRLFGLEVQSWIRTNFIGIPYGKLRAITPFAITASDEELFSRNHRKFFKESAPLSENYKRYLRTWLFGLKDPKGEFTSTWFSATPLTPQNFEFMKIKARSILCEHYLGARLKANGLLTLGMNRDIISVFQKQIPQKFTPSPFA